MDICWMLIGPTSPDALPKDIQADSMSWSVHHVSMATDQDSHIFKTPTQDSEVKHNL